MVFATGTLAAGINMPARSTVISSISRRIPSGAIVLKHNDLLQMAGRAGRRGFDLEGEAPSDLSKCKRGHIRVLLHPFLPFTLAELA